MSSIVINVRDNINNAWLGLGDISKLSRSNPLFGVRLEDIGTSLIKMMRKPGYLSFAAKLLLNIDLLPIQSAILEELWTHPFPMYIASRGFGKLLRGNEKIRIQGGWKEMKDIVVGDRVYGSDGKLTKVISKTPLQQNVDFYRITLRDGRTIDCCKDHMWKVWDKNKNKKGDIVYSEVTTEEMFKNYFNIRKDSKSSTYKLTKEYRYALPINAPLKEEKDKTLPIHPYVLGVLLGDGGLTQKTITITNTDIELLQLVEKYLPYGYKLCRHKNSISYGIKRCDKKVVPFYQLCKDVGIFKLKSDNKHIPEVYQYASYKQKLDLIKGLMDTDGYSKKSVIEYYTISNQLAHDFLNIARSIGLHCKLSIKQSWFKNKRYADCNRISIYTKDEIFNLSRKLTYVKHKISKQGSSKYEKVFITNIEYIGKDSGYCIAVDNKDKTYITKDYIVTHNSYLLAVYALLKCALYPGTKIVICGAAFRQSKIIFDYMDQIWSNAHILRSICDNNSGAHRDVDRCTFFINDSWAIAIPIGNGDKIRGLRAHTIIADEFSAIPVDIYETVIAGFAAVSANPIDNVREAAARQEMARMGVFTADAEYKYDPSKQNQAIISGTTDYAFKNFADYWRRYKAIIESRGNPDLLKDVLGDNITTNFDYRDYTIIRVPYELIPSGFMDDKVVARAKATGHSAMYMMEYGTVFVDDSDGFFKRTLVESCVASDKNLRNAHWPIWASSGFEATLHGDKNKQYVFGVDPASESDSFAIVVLEVHQEHSRIVYGWTTTRMDFKRKRMGGSIKEHDFYCFCARKIRDLMKVFPCTRIGLDAQGGGIAVAEALQDPKNLEEGEIVILPVIEEDKEKDTDLLPGLHMLEMCQFARADWTAEANHGLRKAFEDKTLLFPRFDTVTLELAIANDKINNSELTYDTLEDCVLEIEALKDELCTITMTRTGTGVNSRDRWDTPEVKLPNSKKGRLRKDRYSALLMANMMAKYLITTPPPTIYNAVGGTARGSIKSQGGQMYIGPDWFVSSANQMFDSFVSIKK